MTGFVVLLLTN